MKGYAHHGFQEFALALGYKGEVIKNYFLDYSLLNSHFTVHLATGEVLRQQPPTDDWIVHLMDTGLATMTGGRIKRLEKLIGRERFMATYGDGVSNLDLKRLLQFHVGHGKLATVTAVRPPARFGGLRFENHQVLEFTEKPQIGEGWINGGFFVFEPEVFQYIRGDDTSLEREPLEGLVAEGQLMAYPHEGFWQCMDTMREHRLLEQLWSSGNAPWKVWPEESQVALTVKKAA
jgi:glucose-1-phosphate cytidylyltransferase